MTTIKKTTTTKEAGTEAPRELSHPQTAANDDIIPASKKSTSPDGQRASLDGELFACGEKRSARALDVLRRALKTEYTQVLGEDITRHDIKTDLPAFRTLPSYKTEYPPVVIEALADLYMEYNKAFRPLVEANRESAGDYRFNVSKDGSPVNHFVQIDMVGLPEAFLKVAPNYTREEIREVLRGYIFEIENSLAGYQLLSKIFSDGSATPTRFERTLKEGLAHIRQEHGKYVVLLAVTQEKYDAMRRSEFGKNPDEPLSNKEVKELSGFDGFFGPNELKKYLQAKGSLNDVLLYVRSSDPTAKLKNPKAVVDNPILDDETLRAIVKEHSLTFNIDAPNTPSDARINDTKEYLPTMNMAFRVDTFSDLFTEPFAAHVLAQKPWPDFKGQRLSHEFSAWLHERGVDPEDVAFGRVPLRAKPLKGTYGCYGHVRGGLPDRDVRKELRRGLTDRGAYLIQLEIPTPRIQDSATGQTVTYIDRNFFAMGKDGPVFMGGFRSIMDVKSREAVNGRIHGSSDTIWAEIVPAQEK